MKRLDDLEIAYTMDLLARLTESNGKINRGELTL